MDPRRAASTSKPGGRRRGTSPSSPPHYCFLPARRRAGPPHPRLPAVLPAVPGAPPPRPLHRRIRGPDSFSSTASGAWIRARTRKRRWRRLLACAGHGAGSTRRAELSPPRPASPASRQPPLSRPRAGRRPPRPLRRRPARSPPPPPIRPHLAPTSPSSPLLSSVLSAGKILLFPLPWRRAGHGGVFDRELRPPPPPLRHGGCHCFFRSRAPSLTGASHASLPLEPLLRGRAVLRRLLAAAPSRFWNELLEPCAQLEWLPLNKDKIWCTWNSGIPSLDWRLPIQHFKQVGVGWVQYRHVQEAQVQDGAGGGRHACSLLRLSLVGTAYGDCKIKCGTVTHCSCECGQLE